MDTTAIKEIIAKCSDVKIKKTFFSKKAVYGSAGTPLRRYALFLTDKDATELSKGIANDDVKCLAHVCPLTNGQNRLDVYATDDGLFAAIRLYKFVPYLYEPRSEWTIFTGDASKPIRIAIDTLMCK